MNHFRLFVILLFFLQFHGIAQVSPFEKSNGKKTATYTEVINWYKQLDHVSPQLFMKEMGQTDAGYPLHLVMVSADGKFDPVQWHREGKVVILINNGIHPGEPDGIDASMMLVRDIKDRKLILPENVVIAFIPVYNIGGCLNRNAYTRANQNGPEEYGFRGNSQNLDLNRDFTKCDSREAKSFATLFHFLDPDIFLDTHVSDGADYQHTMTLITTQYDKLSPVLGPWLKETFEPSIYRVMETLGWDLIPYVDFETTDFSKGMRMFYEQPRYSSGYAALFNTLSFISETHMLKPFAQRVKSTYDLILTIIKEASRQSSSLLDKRAEAKKTALSQTVFPLSWTVDSAEFSEITFKGYEADSAKSEATGLQKMFYNHNKPYTRKIKFFNSFKPVNTVTKPLAYIISQGWYEVVDLLKLNGVKMQAFSSDTLMTVGVYHIDAYKSRERAYEKHHKNYAVSASLSMQPITILKGDYLVEMNQPVNRYIIEMLEPTGDDSFFSWNFFDAILQQKEGYSDYRWEDIAAGLLKKDPLLKQKLEEKKAADPRFAADVSAILDFIYMNSAYHEKNYLRYPVYRLEKN